jgi:GntR family transcriptional regulator
VRTLPELDPPAEGAPPVPRVGGPSRTQQVLDTMIAAIRRGAFPDGRLPPEDKLADMLGVSRTTVRRALQSLEQIGLIERRPRRGTRLRVHAKPDLLALHGLVPFPTLLRELGHEVTSRVGWNRIEQPDPDLNMRLKRDVGSGFYEINVLLFADGSPAVAMRERFPDDVATQPADADLQAGSILLVSERCFKDKIHHAVATVEPQAAAGDSAQNPLSLPAGAPFLMLQETFYSRDEIPLAVSQVSVNPEFVTFSVFRRFL